MTPAAGLYNPFYYMTLQSLPYFPLFYFRFRMTALTFHTIWTRYRLGLAKVYYRIHISSRGLARNSF